jgi:UDP-glucuronate decarboxylase
MVAMMESNDQITGPFNVGNPEEVSMLELAELILKLTGSTSKLVFLPLPADDPQRRQPDITVAREMLNWKPKVNLKDGLKETITYFKNALK